MLRLYMDVHVKAAITAGIRRRGIDVVTAQEDEATRLEDVPLLDRATALGRVLFSEGDDLLAITRARQIQGCSLQGSFMDINSRQPLGSMCWISK
jgi:hypothetical protein